MSEISDLANSIYISEFDSNSEAVSLSSIAAWLTENIGLLNTLINTSFSGLDPGMNLEERAIYKQMYLYNYYGKQTRNILRGIVSTSSSDNILMVADGDNRIQFANKNEISKTYKDLAKDAKQVLDGMVAKYNLYASKPLQVGGVEAAIEEDISADISTSQGDLFNGLILDGGSDG